MSSKDDLVRRALAEKAILDAATALNQDTRTSLSASMKAGERQPCEIDGVDLGMVYMTKPTTSARVVDQEAFMAWVAEHAPGAIVTRTVTEVSPAWVKSILAKGCTDDGEVPDGLGEVTGKPILTVKPTEQARALARGLVQRELE